MARCVSLAALAVIAAATAGCAAASLPSQPGERIVSLDLCADQMLAALAPRQAIAALSPESRLDPGLAHIAPELAPRAETILAARPTLVVRSYGGDAALAVKLQQAGIRVVQLDMPLTLAAIPASLEKAGAALGQPARARAMADDMRAQLALPMPAGPSPSILYLTPAGITTGPGSLIAETLAAAGFRNVAAQPGWAPMPLEQLARERPDAVLAGFFDKRAFDQNAWSSVRHPVAARQLAGVPALNVSGARLSCGNWHMTGVLRDLRHLRASL